MSLGSWTNSHQGEGGSGDLGLLHLCVCVLESSLGLFSMVFGLGSGFLELCMAWTKDSCHGYISI